MYTSLFPSGHSLVDGTMRYKSVEASLAVSMRLPLKMNGGNALHDEATSRFTETCYSTKLSP